ncbi:MAG: methylenetetrahydrofolate reductase [Coriobacteriales bacterium]|nr:methylenetetrahydrofolate reductase [Coriobacteriales bacterium]
MRISDILAGKQTFSFEIFPPKGELPVDQAREVSRALAAYDPDWISVTFSAGGSGNSGNTFAIAHALEHELDVNALAHFTCMGATVADVDRGLDAMRAAGISNVLALRGDRVPGRDVVDFTYASDLIAHIKVVAPEMCIGAACYPEGHVECEDFEQSMRHLYLKQEAGADFLVSQLFFNNEDFYRFREMCLRYRIKIPIVAGIMPFTSEAQIKRMAFTCGASIPSRVIKRLVAAGDQKDAQARAGMEYACEQVADLAANGVDGIHIYSMNHPEIGRAMHDVLVGCGYLKA